MPGDPDDPGEQVGPTDPVGPTLVPRDAAEQELCLRVSQANLDRGLDATTPGDTVALTVTFENHSPRSVLRDAVLRYRLPDGVTFVEGTAQVTVGGAAEGHDGRPAGGDGAVRSLSADDGGADGPVRTVAAEADSYDKATRTIAVHVGDLRAGRQARLTFHVTVNPEAVGTELFSTGYGVGTLPSRFVGTVSEPGKAFRPDEGQAAYMLTPGRVVLQASQSLPVTAESKDDNDPKGDDSCQ